MGARHSHQVRDGCETAGSGSRRRLVPKIKGWAAAVHHDFQGKRSSVVRFWGAVVTCYQIFRRASDGTWKPVRGLVYTVLSNAEKCISRSREPLLIKAVRG